MQKALRLFESSPAAKEPNAGTLLAALHNNMGVIYVDLEVWADAKMHFERAVAHAPGGNHPHATSNLELLRRDGRV